jgi:hypothetical protein
VWSFWPTTRLSKSLQLSSGEQLELTWTDAVRIGEPGHFRLSFIPTSKNENALSSSSTQPVDRLIPAPNRIVEARLEDSNLLIKPSQEYQQPLIASQPIHMEWTFFAPHSGIYPAVVWVYFLSFPGENGEGIRELVAVLQSPVEANSFMGVDQAGARWRALFELIGGGVIYLWLYFKRLKSLQKTSI